jgi:hypothetical protein
MRSLDARADENAHVEDPILLRADDLGAVVEEDIVRQGIRDDQLGHVARLAGLGDREPPRERGVEHEVSRARVAQREERCNDDPAVFDGALRPGTAAVWCARASSFRLKRVTRRAPTPYGERARRTALHAAGGEPAPHEERRPARRTRPRRRRLGGAERTGGERRFVRRRRTVLERCHRHGPRHETASKRLLPPARRTRVPAAPRQLTGELGVVEVAEPECLLDAAAASSAATHGRELRLDLGRPTAPSPRASCRRTRADRSSRACDHVVVFQTTTWAILPDPPDGPTTAAPATSAADDPPTAEPSEARRYAASRMSRPSPSAIAASTSA